MTPCYVIVAIPVRPLSPTCTRPSPSFLPPFLPSFYARNSSENPEKVEREARAVTVHALKQVEPPLPLPRLGLEVECGGGFYVRTLIEDVSRAIGSRGHMTVLERTKQVSGGVCLRCVRYDGRSVYCLLCIFLYCSMRSM